MTTCTDVRNNRADECPLRDFARELAQLGDLLSVPSTIPVRTYEIHPEGQRHGQASGAACDDRAR